METEDEGRCYLCGRPLLCGGEAIAICERCDDGLVKSVAVRCGCGHVFKFPREIAALGYISEKTGLDWIGKALNGEPLIVPIYGCDECFGAMVWRAGVEEEAIATGDSHEPWAVYEFLSGFGRGVEMPKLPF